MIFLCFSVKDRIPLINDFYHFLSNFGIDIWYDRRNIYLGDNRNSANITNGAQNPNVNYAIIFYSDNFRNGNICLEEYEILVNRYNKNEVFLFPVFISNIPEQIDNKFDICKTLVYKQITNQSDFSALCLHIIAKITSDELESLKYQTIKDIELQYKNRESLPYRLTVEYQNIKKTNYNMRIAFLFSLYMIISYQNTINYFHYKTMNFIYHQNCLEILIDEKRELQIMENIIVYEFSLL
ncbi:MAG: toll/interleukin-1 receptor domain-containing protein [Clostridium sp.]|nr:toll/interleukin-1 receptor domain-containing protein [Clostridium sp.]